MYYTPFASLRVPGVDDTDMSTALINLADDIQYKTDVNKRRLAELTRRRGVGLRGTTTSLPSATAVALPFATVEWDSDGYFNPATNTVVTLTRGLWMMMATVSFSGSGTLQWALMDLNGASWGNVFAKQNGQFGTSVTSVAQLSGAGLVYISGATEQFTAHVYQVSGGTGSIFISSLAAYKIGNQ